MVHYCIYYYLALILLYTTNNQSHSINTVVCGLRISSYSLTTTTNVDTELAIVHIIQSMCAIWNGDWGFGVFSIQFGEEEDTIEVTVRVSSLSSLTSVKFHSHPSVSLILKT